MKKFFHIEEAAGTLGVSIEVVEYCIKQEWVKPCPHVDTTTEGDSIPSQDQLDDEDLARLNLIHELRDRIGVNNEGIPLILHLVDQLHLAYAMRDPQSDDLGRVGEIDGDDEAAESK